MSQKQIIVKYLKDKNEWIKAYELRSKNTPFGWLGFQGDRRARELAKEGIIQHRIKDGLAEYHYKEIIEPQPLSREEEEKKMLIIATG